MIYYNSNKINDWNLGDDNNIKVYKDNAVCYHKVSSDAPPTPPAHDYSQDYLTFVALEDGIFRFDKSGLSYSLDSGTTWITSVSTPMVASGQTVMWKGNMTVANNGIGFFTATLRKRFVVQGNIMSLLYGDNFTGQTSLSGKSYAFRYLFRNCISLISAENLILPATTLADSCYNNMFNGCTSLTTAPSLPATTLANSCYNNMFNGCTSLTTAPSLPATTLANGCYIQMFNGCSSLSAITCLATRTTGSATANWLYGVSSSGTFTKAASMSSWTSGVNGIPTNWTVEDAE